jgi:single-strand DNA-binding protein
MNKVMLIGRLTRDSELRYMADSREVLGFNLAVDDGFGDDKKTIWFRCYLWGKRALSLEQYLKKGTQVWVEGKLSHKDGSPRIWGDPPKASYEVNVFDIVLLGNRKEHSNVEEDISFL